MKKELFSDNRSRLIFALISLIVILAVCFSTMGIISHITNLNDGKVTAVISTLTYTENNAKKEIKSLQRFVNTKPVSVGVQGKLYRALTEISYMTGDDMLYNKYTASALFYLNLAKDTESAVYLHNKYIGRLYSNGCYNSAAEVLKDLDESNDVSTFSPEMQASYYLSVADVMQMQGLNADEHLANAERAINMMDAGGQKLLQIAKHNLLTARSCILQDKFKKAEKLLMGYNEDDNFGLGKDQVYVVCDYKIPYYEIRAKLLLHDGKTKQAYSCVDKYISCCDSYKFRAMKLNLLQYIVGHNDANNNIDNNKYHDLEAEASKTNLEEMTNEYGQFLLNDIDSTTEHLADTTKNAEQAKNRLMLAIIAVYAIILIYCFGSIFMDYVNRDGLTNLKNRKKYEKIRIVCERKKIPYCLLIMDIDNFKAVNDTYGHEQGDNVLRRIADTIRRYTERGISAYRYGGEEICLVMLKIPEKQAREIAERLRYDIEQTVGTDEMRITISGGIAVSQNGENVFTKCDQKLYEAKRTGKNRIL